MPKQRPSEHAFRTTAQALDALPEGQEKLFLARLILIMAEELANPARFEDMVRRAASPDAELA
jgi:hypothetical protein